MIDSIGYIALLAILFVLLYIDIKLFKQALKVAPYRHVQKFLALHGPKPSIDDYDRWSAWQRGKLRAMNEDHQWFKSHECRRMTWWPFYNIFLWLRARYYKLPWPYGEI